MNPYETFTSRSEEEYTAFILRIPGYQDAMEKKERCLEVLLETLSQTLSPKEATQLIEAFDSAWVEITMLFEEAFYNKGYREGLQAGLEKAGSKERSPRKRR
ncbi:MAG: hypothetical protein HY731_10945 [Candidatus Tectomicrobia bacterium]|nr:hypothetical protein [Candidatus Tectomicrobia bacterium]